ncbi:MAG: AAA family ATPase [Candidatus Hydrothermarchaeales archaeon]
MPRRRLKELLGKYQQAIRHYCTRLGWDYNTFKTSISDEGISHPDLYLEEPNENIVERITQFLDPSNQSSVFIIWDDVGMGKSSIMDFVSLSLDELENYHVVLITDPRLTSLQILRVIAQEIGAETEVWSDRGQVKNALWGKLWEIAEKGISLVIWVDEAEKINRDIISEMRALSDLKTEDGAKTCKLILSGTPSLMQKIEGYIKADPEDAAAFEDRASLNTFSLNKWSSTDIYNYWRLLAEYCGGTNPFLREAAETVLQISDGKPRTIAQITKLAFHIKALEILDGKNSDIEINTQHVLKALREQLGE